MTKSLLRTLVGIVGIATLFCGTVPARAATLTFNDPSCGSFTVSGSGGSFTLVCAQLTCAIQSSAGINISPVGTSTILNASCTPVPSNGYAWTAGAGQPGCPALPGSSGQTQTLPAPAGTTTIGPCVYNVTGDGGAAGQGSASISLNYSSAPPAAPSGCTLTPSVTQVPSGGGPVTFTAACTGGGAPTSYAWTGPGVVTPTTGPSQTVTVTAGGIFSVTPSNSGGNGNTASTNITVGGGGGGGSTLPATCSIGGVTYNVLDINAQNKLTSLPMSIPTVSSGFSGPTVLVATLVAPSAPTGLPTTTAIASVGEYGSLATYRYAWFAKSPCDTSGVGPFAKQAQEPSFNYSIGGADLNAVNMQPGETWYLIVINRKPNGASSCPSGNCDVVIKWYPPN